MRITANNHIKDLWEAGGPFVGDDAAPHGRVTVEIDWLLTMSTHRIIGTYDHGPVRWFQRADNSQVETEIPNIKTIDISRTIDTDAATCDIVMANQKMIANDATPVTGSRTESVGQPGYYTFTRGDSPAETLLWGHATNEWHDVLQPNALIRTYQGYGGRGKTIDQALADGNLLLTGTWLVDGVKVEARTGDISINCRDMVKLLIEQHLYPPLVPTTGSVHYPISYDRWKFINREVIPYGTTTYHAGFNGDNVILTVGGSSSDLEGASIDGHVSSDAIDGTDISTYWLSGGHIGGTASDDMEFIEFDFGSPTLINGCNIQPFGGLYKIYISVMQNGAWQGTSIVPYSGTTLAATIRIPYVRAIACGWEQAVTAYLNGGWNAQKIRLTFGHLTKTSVGPKFYRAGVRNFEVGAYTTMVSAPNNRAVVGIERGYASTPRGYWIAGSDGGVFTFGNLKFYGARTGRVPVGATIVDMAGNDAGSGYRLVDSAGGVYCYGDAQFHGSLPGLGIVTTLVAGIENGDHGTKGYYLFDYEGHVFAFGGASYHGNYTLGGLCMAMASAHNKGYWMCNQAGAIETFGTVGYHGGSPSLGGANITAMTATSTGNGYWLVADNGAVYAYGDATYHGGANNLALADPIVGMTATGTDDGYLLVGADGGVFAYGDAQYHGSLTQQFQEFGDGNYTDYTDIVKDIVLWCGWWYYRPSLGQNSPAVPFGNYETTGIFSPTLITEDYFDKKPAIDVINALKEIVGFIIYADETGGFHFESPNVWSIGNFLETGVPTALIPLIDESLQMTDYTLLFTDIDAQSTITIANEDPALNQTDLKSVTIISQWGGDLLNGIVKPALWSNGKFVDVTVMRTMAELIDLHLFMGQRQGQVAIQANPILQIGDQVRIFERATADTYVHYLRGYNSTMNLESGQYTMSVQTHWMGDGGAANWFLKY